MLDVNYIRENAEVVRKAIADKQLSATIDLDELLDVDKRYLALLQKVETHRALRNQLSKDISQVGQDARQKLIDEAAQVKQALAEMETELKQLELKREELLLWVPNVPAHDVPVGTGDTQNVVIRTEGIKPEYTFEPKDHLEIATNLKIVDTERGAKIGGFRSYFLVGAGMLLEQAILRYALDFMVDKGFTPMSVPVMVNKDYLVGTGYFPWGEEDHYHTQDAQGLIGTAEVSLTAYYANEVLEEADLPVKIVGQSPCFRREVGSHGQDNRGIFRVHYFNKVEQVVLTVADEEETRRMHDQMLGYTEQILKDFGIHYNVLLMCSGDMGAGQRKKYDIEIWFPGQGRFREIASASYFNDFQSRRLNMRYKAKDGSLKYVYTLNNTVIPTPRMLANILETYQQADGTVVVPEVLRSYMGGLEVIKPREA